MLPTHLLTAVLFLFTSVSAIDEDIELRGRRGPQRRGMCVSNSGRGVCLILERNKVKKIECGDGKRKCTGWTRRPCTWTGGYADCT